LQQKSARTQPILRKVFQGLSLRFLFRIRRQTRSFCRNLLHCWLSAEAHRFLASALNTCTPELIRARCRF